jgi:hypothetical protein
MSWDIGLAAGSILTGVHGKEVESQYHRQLAEYQAAVLQNKAAHARWEGRPARKQLAEKQARDMASYRTRVGAGGVTFEGTPTEVIFDREKENLYEQKLLVHDYEMKAYDFLTSDVETSYSGAMKSYLAEIDATEMAFSGAARLYGMAEDKLLKAFGGIG